MEARELRIGNLFLSNTLHVCKVIQIYDNRVQGISDDGNVDVFLFGFHFYPIPLTEEWLLKFGFEKRFLDQEGYVTGWFLWDNLIVVWDDGFTCAISGINIIHVHQFQNLYFALRGEELTLKEKG